jgi:hypothetical protein
VYSHSFICRVLELVRSFHLISRSTHGIWPQENSVSILASQLGFVGHLIT